MRRSLQEWESLWDSLDATDAQKTRAMFEEYARNSGQDGWTTYFFGFSESHARIHDVEKTLTECEMFSSVELTLACLKEKVHQYKPYSMWNAGCKYADDHSHHDYLVAGGDEQENRYTIASDLFWISKDVFSIRFYYDRYNYRQHEQTSNSPCPHFRYTVITPQGHRVTDTIFRKDLYKAPVFQDHPIRSDGTGSLGASDFSRDFLSSIFEITSKRGHTRGPHLQETDELNIILQLIKKKTNIDYSTIDHVEVFERYEYLSNIQSFAPQSAWNKQGDFTRAMSLSNSLLAHQQHYTNTTSSTISMIQLSKYDDGRLSLRVGTHNNETFDQLNVSINMFRLPQPISCNVYEQSRFWSTTENKRNRYIIDRATERERFFGYVDSRGIVYGFSLYDGSIHPAEAGLTYGYNDKAELAKLFDVESFGQMALTRAQLNKLMSKIRHAPPAFGTPDNNKGLMEYTLNITNSDNSDDLALMSRFLDAIISVDPGTTEVISNIAGLLGIYRSNKKQDTHALLTHAKAAQKLKDYTTIWNLANKYKKDWKNGQEMAIEVLIEIFEAISGDNPHYAESRIELLSIISMSHDVKSEQVRLEQEFRYAVEAQEVQSFTDRLYEQLCGSDGTRTVTMNHVKPDIDTLLRLAELVKQQREEIEQLQKQRQERQASSGNITNLALAPDRLFTEVKVQELPTAESMLLLEDFHSVKNKH